MQELLIIAAAVVGIFLAAFGFLLWMEAGLEFREEPNIFKKDDE